MVRNLTGGGGVRRASTRPRWTCRLHRRRQSISWATTISAWLRASRTTRARCAPGSWRRNPNGELRPADGPVVIAVGEWRRWRLELLRVARRETTAVLSLDENALDEQRGIRPRLQHARRARPPSLEERVGEAVSLFGKSGVGPVAAGAAVGRAGRASGAARRKERNNG
jgi:hypothetical protein